MPRIVPPLSPSWKAYLDAFDHHLRSRGDPESRIAMRLAFEFAMSDNLGNVLAAISVSLQHRWKVVCPAKALTEAERSDREGKDLVLEFEVPPNAIISEYVITYGGTGKRRRERLMTTEHFGKDGGTYRLYMELA